MVIKINSKPIEVKEEEDKERLGWVHLGVSMIGYLLGFWVLDYAAYLFLGVHPFPAIKFVGTVLSWLS